MWEVLLDKDLADTVSYWATSLGILIAVAGAIGAY
jgi:hypothetical protein